MFVIHWFSQAATSKQKLEKPTVLPIIIMHTKAPGYTQNPFRTSDFQFISLPHIAVRPSHFKIRLAPAPTPKKQKKKRKKQPPPPNPLRQIQTIAAAGIYSCARRVATHARGRTPYKSFSIRILSFMTWRGGDGAVLSCICIAHRIIFSQRELGAAGALLGAFIRRDAPAPASFFFSS